MSLISTLAGRGSLVLHAWSPWIGLIAIFVVLAITGFNLIQLPDSSRVRYACLGARANRSLGAHHIIRNIGPIALAGIAAIGASSS